MIETRDDRWICIAPECVRIDEKHEGVEHTFIEVIVLSSG